MNKNNQKKELVIVAGEASGDLHGAHLVQSLHAAYPDTYQISAVGGRHLAELDVYMIDDLAQHGVTGFLEVLKHARLIRQAYLRITAYLEQVRPALLILIDYPGFNLRLARFAKEKLGLTVLYYISPQIWAWKANRIHTIKKYVDHMATILPFEKAIYEQANVPCSFVGHPLLEHMLPINKQSARQTLQISEQAQVVALLPGSRRNELKYHLPVMIGAVKLLLKKFADLQFVIPVASTLSREDFSPVLHEQNLPIRLTHEPAQVAMRASDMVVVASGTASLECALLELPMCIIYKTSTLSSMIVSQVVKIKYGGLCNLIANRMIVPELLQADCTPETIYELVSTYLSNSTQINTMLHQLRQVKQKLASSAADTSLSKIIYQLTEHDGKKR